MSLRFTLPGRPSFSPLTWRRGTLVKAAGVVVALATLAPGTARADTLPAATGLHTSPGTACPAVTPSTIGDGDLFLYAGVPDSVGTGADATFDVWDTATSATLEDGAVPAVAGGNAVFLLRQAALGAVAGGAITEFSWNVTISDGTNTGPVSVTCSFFFDPTHPGNPVITPTSTSYTIGTPATFTFSPDTSGSTTAAYTYELNSGQGVTVSAGPDGSATVTVTPTSGVNLLTVTADSPGGNLGGSATFLFSAATPPPAADGDMTGDGIPDLVTVGGTSGVPSGLWVASGKPTAGGTTGSGEIITPAVNIGASGNGSEGDQSATDFDGAQVVTGQFTGEGLQDYFVYYPSGQGAGIGVV